MGECCDAILEFKREGRPLVICELEKGHVGNHRALMFEWQGEGVQFADNLAWHRGFGIMKIHTQRIFNKLRG